MSQQNPEFRRPSPQEWDKLEMIAEIDRQAFGEDGISVFNLSQFCRADGVFCLIDKQEVTAEAILLKNLHDSGAVLFAFAVKQSSHRKGHGTLLMRHIINAAATAGITYIELTMNPENQPARNFYVKTNGFQKKEELLPHPHKKEPRWLMRLEIPARII
ncbi:MAG: GNAT family N-acetyltransferase [Erysipelotrichia bacterium]|nr:GNAT family N-acetyltransferase [Erysipelotrichia bacterium]